MIANSSIPYITFTPRVIAVGHPRARWGAFETVSSSLLEKTIVLLSHNLQSKGALTIQHVLVLLQILMIDRKVTLTSSIKLLYALVRRARKRTRLRGIIHTAMTVSCIQKKRWCINFKRTQN